MALDLGQMARSHIKRISEQVVCAQAFKFDFLSMFISDIVADRRCASRHSYHIPGKVTLPDKNNTKVLIAL